MSVWEEPAPAPPIQGYNGLPFGALPSSKSSSSSGRKKGLLKSSRNNHQRTLANSAATASADGGGESSQSEDVLMLTSTGEESAYDGAATKKKSSSSLPDKKRKDAQILESKVRRKFQKKFPSDIVGDSCERPTLKRLGGNSGHNLRHLQTPTTIILPASIPTQATTNHDDGGTSTASSVISDPPDSPETPPGLMLSDETVPKHKKIKISPEKKRPQRAGRPFNYGPNYELEPRQQQQQQQQGGEEEQTNYNDDFCSACHGSGRFICCESCPRSFHFSCTNPPMDEKSLPTESWYCNECYTRRHPPPKPARGLFAQLIDKMLRRNPVVFSLPQSLRDRYEGVATGPTGDYLDIYDKQARTTRGGFIEEADPLKVHDKNGKTLICYKCGNSAIHGQGITTCGVCPASWHLDCLDPPMTSVSFFQKRWVCPFHTGNQLDKDGTRRKRIVRHSKRIETSLRRGFKNDGTTIEIEHDDENKSSLELIGISDLLARQDMNRKIKFKQFSVEGIIYKVPERAVKLDFIEQVKTQQIAKSIQNQNQQNPGCDNRFISLSALDELASRPVEIRQAVRDLVYLQSSGTREFIQSTSLNNLVDALKLDVAVDKSNNMQQQQQQQQQVILSAPLHTDNNDNNNNNIKSVVMSSENLNELLAIKQLVDKYGSKEKIAALLK